VTRDLEAVLASIDGALADAEFPDAMRWSPEPEQVEDLPVLRFDGRIVPQPPQRYEAVPEAWAVLVRGGSPAALRILGELDDPAVQAAIRFSFEETVRRLTETLRPVFERIGRFTQELARIASTYQQARLLPAAPPADPRECALHAARHRGTGPDTQVQHRPRPRRHR
jgi:hypothetical protein